MRLAAFRLRPAVLLGISPHYMNRKVHCQSGFTLIEALVVVAVGMALVAVGVPALIEVIAAQRVKTATFDFYSTLVLARSEAIKRAAVVDVVPLGGDFANGWDVRVGAAVLRTRTSLPQVAVTAPTGVALAYDNNGRLTAPGRYTLTLAAPGYPNIATRCVVIDPSGRASVRLDQNHDGNCFNG